MPTTCNEADKIVELCIKHGLRPLALLGLAKDLKEQVGDVTTNDSVRVTMNMLHERAKQLQSNPTALAKFYLPDPARVPWLILYWCIIILHLDVWVGLFASGVMVFLRQPWYISMPIISFAIYLLTTDSECPITRWENYARSKLGWPRIVHFTHWYFICPLFHGRTCNRKCATIEVGPR